jgi:N-acetylglutamate synthase-like GNAT family acetyltransferase
MQIRFANRQDEAPVRAFLESQGAILDLAGADNDLRNLDLNYFGKDGLFIVAEEEGKVIAFAGARKLDSDNDILELKRLIVPNEGATLGTAGDAIKERFLAIIKNHAFQMDYKTIQVKE